jgi:hypothetical protein
MPAYVFEIRWAGGEKISSSYLPSDDSARDFARILAQTFKSSNQYRGSAHITVKDNDGMLIGSIQF